MQVRKGRLHWTHTDAQMSENTQHVCKTVAGGKGRSGKDLWPSGDQIAFETCGSLLENILRQKHFHSLLKICMFCRLFVTFAVCVCTHLLKIRLRISPMLGKLLSLSYTSKIQLHLKKFLNIFISTCL